jgi:hypothetical protein
MNTVKPVHFYDSANPANIPSGVHAAVCINGEFAWSARDINRMAKIFRYIAHDPGGNLAEWAPHARGVDIEPGCIWPPERAMDFLIARHKSNGDATAYCDRSTLPTVRQLVREAKIEVYEWVSTLDGTQNVTGSWAVQYYGGVDTPFDISVLHGRNDFVAP